MPCGSDVIRVWIVAGRGRDGHRPSLGLGVGVVELALAGIRSVICGVKGRLLRVIKSYYLHERLWTKHVCKSPFCWLRRLQQRPLPLPVAL